MVGIPEASAAFSGLKAAFEIAKGLQALDTNSKVKLATMDLMEKILSAQQDAFAAQEAQATLLKRINALEAEIDGMKKWDAEKERYELKEVYAGAFAYVVKQAMRGDEPAHWLCVNCYQHGALSLLQLRGRAAGEQRTKLWGCPACNGEIRTFYTVSPNGTED